LVSPIREKGIRQPALIVEVKRCDLLDGCVPGVGDLEVRPIFHRRPDRVINHVRLCFLAYWLSARTGKITPENQDAKLSAIPV
jgi:hypothetical protein